MARTRHRSDEQDATRIVDPRRHFLGLMKGGEAYFYCAKCKRFLLVTDQDADHHPASPAPLAGLGRGAEARDPSRGRGPKLP